MELLSNTYVAFFVIVALGIAIGNIKVKGISLDLSAIIFVALVFGHFGVKIPGIIQKIGLIFFIYSVGIQAGPGFFKSFKAQGASLIFIAFVVVVSGALTSVGMAYACDIDLPLVIGIFTGALTSTPGLAAAIESTKSSLASIGYGIAYPFGVIGVILFVKIAPKLFKVNIKEEEDDYEREVHADYPELFNKNFVVENPNIFGKTIGELRVRTMTKTNIARIMHEGESIIPTMETELCKGDIVKVIGTEVGLEKIRLLIGNETDIEMPKSKKFFVRNFLVSNKEIVNSTIGELGLFENFDATATRIRRSGIDITPTAKSKLQLGDKVVVVCAEGTVPRLSKLFGDSREKLIELDLFPVSVGIILGILIGIINIPLFGVDFHLGLTGGVLISSLLLSKIGKTGNIVWNVAGSTNQFIRKLGLVFFLASVGTNAGGSLVETVSEYGLQLFLVGAVITMVPMILAVVIGRLYFKTNFLTLLGALTGSMTSTPALSALEPMTDSNAPKIAYATVYPFALVIIVISSQVMSLL